MNELRSEGQRLLREALKDRGASAELARRLGVAPSVVSRWLEGRQSPATKSRMEIAALHGIAVLDWDAPAKGAA